MDVQLQELIDKIKKEGVDVADASAAKIVSDANAQAERIISDAKAKADELIAMAKAESEKMEKAGEAAILQAGRNILIAFRDAISSELSALISKEIANVYNAEMLKTLIPDVVKSWAKDTDVEDLAVLVPESNLDSLMKNFVSMLKSEIDKGLEVKVDSSMSSGFKIGMKDGSVYYDFSSDSVAELFSSYLNPKVSKIMKDASGGLV